MQAQVEDITEAQDRLYDLRENLHGALKVLKTERREALAPFSSDNFKKTEREDRQDKEQASKQETLDTAAEKND